MTGSALDRHERRDWLRLARADQVGPVTFFHLLDRFGSAAAAIAALPALARRAGRGNPVSAPTIEAARAELAAGEAIGARLVARGEPDYPRLLAALDPPPPVLWVLGDAALLARRSVAIVGARIASAAGQRLARGLAADLGEAGYVVVSGLARGIDAAAHAGALPFGTVAVLAGGVDDVYPPEHASLHAEVAARGCIVSERPIGHAARAVDFPRRNRIISGLSLGVVVVEAELKSGSLITARLAGEQGRDVFAVPGSPLDPRARGANELLRQGATLVEDAGDVLRMLDGHTGAAAPGLPAYEAHPADAPAADEALVEALSRLLSPSPTAYDELARASGAALPQVLAALVELDLAGRAELLPGSLAIGR